jgi:hypothetical protein
LVFDTSLLAAFDHPGVDPAAQQQAANLLSQQPYQPQSISPPSLPGAGLSEPRPQTVTQGAPYYDPIAIHQGTAPVDYQYSGPSVDMSGYLGLGTYMGIPRQPNQSTDYLNTVNEEFSTIDRGLASAYQGVQQGGPIPADNILQQLGYTNPLYSSQYQQPTPQYGTTNRPGTLGGLLDVNRAGQSQYGGLPGATLSTAIDVYNTEIPIYSDFARNTLKPAAEFLGDRVPQLQGFNMLSGAVGGPSTGDIASAFVPVTLGDVGLEALPGIGSLPDAWRLASRLAPDATDFANVIRRGGQALDNRLGQIDLRSEVGAIRVPGGAPDPNKMTPDNISSISRRVKGGSEKPIFEGIEQAAPAADVPPASAYIPGTEAYARGKSAPDMPDYSNDPGYWESMAKQADTGGNPARSKPASVKRTVTMGDGSAADASPENIQQAVGRYLSRETTQRKIKADPDTFWETVTDQIINAKTRGGKPLMQGVTPDEVKAALQSGSKNLEVKATPDGKLNVTAKSDLETAIRNFNEGDLWADTPPTPASGGRGSSGGGGRRTTGGTGDGPGGNRPLRGATPKKPLTPLSKSPENTVLENLGAIVNLPRTMLAGILDYSYALRHGGGMAISRNKRWREAFGTGAKSFLDEGLAIRTMDEIENARPAWLTDEVGQGLGFRTDNSGTLQPMPGQMRPGLDITPFEGGKLVDREEAFVSRFTNLVPGVRMTARANITFLNKLRANVYDDIVSTWPESMRTPVRLKQLGKYINAATGRGDLGALNEASALLGNLFFSPRYLASLVQAPLYMIRADPLIRKEAMKDMAAQFTGAATLLGLASVAGAAVELDPRSADFGKIRVGNTRVDPWRGYQQIARLVAMIQSGETKSAGGSIYGIDADEAILRFFRTKLSPQAGFAVDAYYGKDLLDRPVEADFDNAWRRLAPLALQGLVEAIQEGPGEGIALSSLSLLGTGAQTYSSTGEQRNKAIADMGFTDPTTGEALTEWHKLSSAQQKEAKERDPSLNDLTDPSPTTEARDAERVAAWEKLKQSGDFDAYFDEYKNISTKYDAEFANQDFPELKNPGEWSKKLQDFYDQSKDIVNDQERNKFREDFVAGLNPDEKAAFEAGTQSSDPNYRKLQQAMDMLQPRYYDQREAAFDELKAKVPKLAAFENYADVWANGTSQDQQYVGTALAGQLRNIRKSDPQADAMLYILGRSDYVLSAEAKAIVDATLAKEGINKKSPNIGRP